MKQLLMILLWVAGGIAAFAQPVLVSHRYELYASAGYAMPQGNNVYRSGDFQTPALLPNMRSSFQAHAVFLHHVKPSIQLGVGVESSLFRNWEYEDLISELYEDASLGITVIQPVFRWVTPYNVRRIRQGGAWVQAGPSLSLLRAKSFHFDGISGEGNGSLSFFPSLSGEIGVKYLLAPTVGLYGSAGLSMIRSYSGLYPDDWLVYFPVRVGLYWRLSYDRLFYLR